MLMKNRGMQDEVIVCLRRSRWRIINRRNRQLIIEEISNVLKVGKDQIENVRVLKKGMTNRSFLFECKNRKYIMRVPGEGTDKLINRYAEAEVYHMVQPHNICDNVIYINPSNGYKITEFLEGARVCDPHNEEDLKRCIYKLREFHELDLEVNHEFSIFKQINFYEQLWNGLPSVYKDYEGTKSDIMSLQDYIAGYAEKKCLAHIDAVPDNFLFFINENGEEEVRLIDWEYASMQDPHIDIAMFCLYSLYNEEEIDNLIDLYFDNQCLEETRTKIYCYIAACGLLWSNWCEYKRNLGVEFGEYSLRQYEYAKDYFKIARERIKE